MKRWPLKLKFGLYAAALSTLALAGSVLTLRPLIYQHQLRELDAQLAENAAELFRDLENFRGAPRDFRKPVPERFIPVGLRLRYLEIEGPEGQMLYRSPNLRGRSFAGKTGGLETIVLDGRNARIGTFVHGFLTLHIGTRLGTIEAMQDDLLHALFWTAPAAAAAVFLCGWWLGRRALKPVSDLTVAAEKIDPAQPDSRLPLPAARDEIFRLTEVLNRSFDRLQLAYTATARFSADASHQLKTPLTILRAGLDALASASLGPEERDEIEGLRKQTRRLTTLVDDLLLLAQIDAGRLKLDPTALDLSGLVAATLDDLEILCAARDLTLESDVPAPLLAWGDARRVAVILQNLGENAVKYASPGGSVRVRGRQVDGTTEVSFANTSPAIPDAHREHLFERFNRAGAGENVQGHGLGLNIARSLARAQGGDVTLVRSDGEWTEFALHLPVPEPQRPAGGD